MPAHAAMPTATIIRVAAIQDLFLMAPSGQMRQSRLVSSRMAGPDRFGDDALNTSGSRETINSI
jgi:hypothetical protein